MSFLVQIRLPDAGRIAAHADGAEPPAPGSRVVVETGSARELATVVETSATSLDAPAAGMARLVRPAGPEDDRAAAEADRAAEAALGVLATLLRRDGIAARPLRAHYDLARKRLVAWYAPAPGGPSDLASLEGEFRRKVRAAAVDLRPVPPREAAALLGGCGPCGRPLCCASWLRQLPAAPARGAAPAPFSACGPCSQSRCCHAFDA